MPNLFLPIVNNKKKENRGSTTNSIFVSIVVESFIFYVV